MKIPTIPHDKALHFIWGYLCSCVVVMLCVPLFKAQPWILPAVALASAALLGWVKEQVDKWSNAKAIKDGKEPTQHVEVADIKYTAYGGAPLAVVLLVVLGLR